MGGAIFNISPELEKIDLTHDLERRNLKVTSEGLSWNPAPNCEDLTKEQLIQLYYYMALTRAVDQEIVKLIRKGLAFGKHLQCAGNEASTVGASFALRENDWLTLGIRDLGAFLVRGIPVSKILAQACGRSTGLSAGWDGSLHMGSRSARIVGLVSHLGTLIPIATGCGFAEKYHAKDGVVLAFIGEGATSTGDFHEALNIASVLRLPLVVVIENNQWAFGTPSRLQYAVPTLALRAIGYGPRVEGYWIDGTNVLTVLGTVREALKRTRHEQTISIIEAVSMRYQGHSLADPFESYVPLEQLTVWKEKDPISVFARRLVDRKLADEQDIQDANSRVAAEVREAALIAEQSPLPDANSIEDHVFVPSPVHLVSYPEPSGTGELITYHKAIQDSLKEEMERDSNLFIIGEDIGISNGAFKITEGFSGRFDGIRWNDYWKTSAPFPQRRVVDAPLAEAGFAGLALGAVLNGLRAVVEFQYADFCSEAFKMLVNYAATETVRGMGPLPIVFRLPSGWAPNTSIYHSVNPESWFASTPGLKIVAPITAFDAKGLLKAAIRDNNPVLFLEYKIFYRWKPESLSPELRLTVPEEDYVVPIGKARVMKEGKDLSVITYGSQVLRAVEAVHRVESEDGVSIELIDLRSVVPYDSHCIQRSVRKTNRALVTCEAPRRGCFGNTIVADIVRSSFDALDAPVQLVAAADTPVPFAHVLENAHLPTVEKLMAGIRDVLSY